MMCIVLKQWRGLMISPEPQDVPGGVAVELEKRGFLKILRTEENETACMAQPETTMKRKRGRPKGSKNRIKPDAVEA